MKDLKDMCMVEKEHLRAFLKASGALNDHIYIRGTARLEQALNQDLSGIVVVPIEPTEEMCRAGQKHMPKDDLGYVIVDAEYIYAAMLSAAQKEKNDD